MADDVDAAAAAGGGNQPAADAYYDAFLRYASDYGEAAARAYYGAWSPPPGAPNPYGNARISPAPAFASFGGTAGEAAAATAATSQAPEAAAAAPAGNPFGARDSSARRGVSNLPAWMTSGAEDERARLAVAAAGFAAAVGVANNSSSVMKQPSPVSSGACAFSPAAATKKNNQGGIQPSNNTDNGRSFDSNGENQPPDDSDVASATAAATAAKKDLSLGASTGVEKDSGIDSAATARNSLYTRDSSVRRGISNLPAWITCGAEERARAAVAESEEASAVGTGVAPASIDTANGNACMMEEFPVASAGFSTTPLAAAKRKESNKGGIQPSNNANGVNGRSFENDVENQPPDDETSWPDGSFAVVESAAFGKRYLFMADGAAVPQQKQKQTRTALKKGGSLTSPTGGMGNRRSTLAWTGSALSAAATASNSKPAAKPDIIDLCQDDDSAEQVGGSKGRKVLQRTSRVSRAAGYLGAESASLAPAAAVVCSQYAPHPDNKTKIQQGKRLLRNRAQPSRNELLYRIATVIKKKKRMELQQLHSEVDNTFRMIHSFNKTDLGGKLLPVLRSIEGVQIVGNYPHFFLEWIGGKKEIPRPKKRNRKRREKKSAKKRSNV